MKSIMKKNIILIILILILIFTYLPNTVYAGKNLGDINKMIGDADNFIGVAGNQNTPIDQEQLKDTSDYIYNILFAIAVVVAFAVGMIIGIQFIMGSVDEKAKIKETLVPYIIGVCIIFGAFTIWKIVVTIGEQVSPSPTISTQQVDETLYCPICNGQLTQEEISRLNQGLPITHSCGSGYTKNDL